MNDTIRRGDVYFCQGSPDAVGSKERKKIQTGVTA